MNNQLTHNEIIQRLCQSGYPTYLVGGAIRDMFAGFDPDDFDISTLATPDQIKEVFEGYAVNTVGKTFGVTIVEGIDVATFRVDSNKTSGAKNCDVSYASSIHEDLSRRDLTINALALCPYTGDVIDDHRGLSDLKNRVLRFVGNPDDRIWQDPNRVIRACRFVAKVQGSFAPETLAAIRRNLNLVQEKVDPERIGIEVKKAMKLEIPSLFFSALHLTGLLSIVFPGMEECVDHDDRRLLTKTVWEHLMLAGDKVSAKFPLVRLAAFLHDVGKPHSFAQNNDGTFVGHEVKSAELVREWLTRFRFSNSEVDFVSNLVRSHMWGGSADATPRAIRKLLFRLNELGVDSRSWLRLRIADRHANLMRNDFNLQEILERATRIRIIGSVEDEIPFNVNSLALKGGEIIQLFGLTPGPLVGKIQKHLLNFVLEEGPESNTVEILTNEINNFLDSQDQV